MGYDLVIDMDLQMINDMGEVPYDIIADTISEDLLEKYNKILTDNELWSKEKRLTMLKASDPDEIISHALLIEFDGWDEALTIPIRKDQFRASMND